MGDLHLVIFSRDWSVWGYNPAEKTALKLGQESYVGKECFFFLSFFEEHAVGKWKEEVSERLAGGRDRSRRWLQIADDCCGLAKICERQKKTRADSCVLKSASAVCHKDSRCNRWGPEGERSLSSKWEILKIPRRIDTFNSFSSPCGTLVQQSCTINYWKP